MEAELEGDLGKGERVFMEAIAGLEGGWEMVEVVVLVEAIALLAGPVEEVAGLDRDCVGEER